MNDTLNSFQKIRPYLLMAAGLMLARLVFGGFVFRLLLVYSLPMIYLYFRLRSRISNPKSRRWFGLLFILLVMAFPLGETLSHIHGLPDLMPLVTIAYLTMPFLLYLFLWSLLFYLLLGLNHLMKIFPPARLKTESFRKASLVMMTLLSIAVVILGIWNHSVIRVNEYRVDVPRKSSRLSSLRVVLVADFHLGSQTRKGFMRTCIDRIQSLSPDLVLIPGDILEGDRSDLNLKSYEKQFRRLRTRYGVFASPGNHEFHGHGRGQNDFIENAGITMLSDAGIQIDQAFYLIGRNDSRVKNRKSLNELLSGAPEFLPIILMNHRPQGFDEVSRTGVDIQVSGHSHNGQLFPLNLVTGLVHDLSWGYRRIRNTHFFVTCGIQLWGPPVRTAGVSELMLIDIRFVH